MHLSEEQLREFEETLRKEAAHLRDQLAHLKNDADFGADVDSFEEESDETEEYANKLGTGKVLEDRLVAVNAALGRIKEKAFGICTACGSALDHEMLRADPESSLCRACKAKQKT